MLWLVLKETFLAIQNAHISGVAPSAAQRQAFIESRTVAGGGREGERVITVAGDVAEISVQGVLTKGPDIMSMLFGGGNTTYAEIISALAIAEADQTVERIVLEMDSPGGEFDGLFDAIAALQSTSKPIEARVSLCASACYALAAQADTIIATNPAARIGSVGVVATMAVREDQVTITSTNAPNKRPDVTTAEGQAIVREELDAMHTLFVGAIAQGRDTTEQNINSNYGRGATLLAGEALNRGMIDSIQAPALRIVEPATSSTVEPDGEPPEAKEMNLIELKAQHPDVYAAAVAEGQNTERERVSAHLILGKQSGDMETACKAIQDGSELTATLQATYMAAGMNRNDVQAAADDDAASAAALDGAAPATATATGEDEGEKIAAAVEANFGISQEG